MRKQKPSCNPRGESREPSAPPRVRVGGSGRHGRPGSPGASTNEEARHEAHRTAASEGLILQHPRTATDSSQTCEALRLQELIRVESVLRKADGDTEEAVAQLGIALWLSRPARRKAA